MQFLVTSKPLPEFIRDGLPNDFEKLELREQAHATMLYTKGSLRQVWAMVAKGRGAAVLFEANSPEQMQEIFSGFPLVKAGYADYQIIQLAPYPGFGTNT